MSLTTTAVLSALRSNYTLNVLAFSSGFAAAVSPGDFVRHPLGCVLGGSIPGGFTVIGANIVALVVPNAIMPIMG